MKRRYLISTLLVLTFVATLVPASTQQGVKDYDPWYDINDDGKIDIKDVAGVASKFGTTGTAINKTELLLELNATIARLLGTMYVDDVNKRLGIGTTSPNYKLDVNGEGYFEDGIETGESASGEGIKFGKKYSFAADINPIVTCYAGYVWWDYSENALKVTETNAYNNHFHAAGYRDQTGASVKDFYDTWISSGSTVTIAQLTANGNWATFELTSEGPNAGYIHIHAFYSNGRLVAHYWYRYQ